MGSMRRTVSDIATYIHRLSEPAFRADVEEAIAKRDEVSFIDVCRRAKIPKKYIASIMPALLFEAVYPLVWPPQ